MSAQRNAQPGNQVPFELRDRAQWVVWKLEQRDGKPTKVPYRAADLTRKASSTDSASWSDYATAERTARAPGVDGGGYVFSPDDPYTGIDFDGVVTADGLHPAAAEVLARLNSYTERSPSGTGVHVFVRACLNGGRHKTEATPWGGAFEVYDRGRFFTVTGSRLRAALPTIEARQAELDALCREMFPPTEPPSPGRRATVVEADDAVLIDRAHDALNGAAFAALWRGDTSGHGGDDSAADLALCSHLAFWAGDDPERIDRLFRDSGLYREKWEREDYRERTIAKALSGGGGSLKHAEQSGAKGDGGDFSPHLSTVFRAPALDDASGGAEREGLKRVEQSGDKGDGEDFPPHSSTVFKRLRFPRPLGDAAYCGLAGEVVKAIEPHTEADPAAVLVSLIAMFGNAIGRGPYFRAGDAEHATNLFVCVVGETSSGRKGTSAEASRRLLESADPEWAKCIASGLVSGEGVIHHVRDARRERRKPKQGESTDADGLVVVDPGAEDKRLLALVTEFAQLLSVVNRKDNTLSAVLRELWDRGRAQTLAKNSPDRATGALVSVLAHITPTELRDRLDSTEIANGFANRFIFIAAKRSRLLPRGGSVPMDVCMKLAPRLADALTQARKLTEVDMTPNAWALWEARYESLTTSPPGLVGAVIGRGAPQVRRLALVYALMDEYAEVHRRHLLAALEVWRYAEESVRRVFGDRQGDRTADQCLARLREKGDEGMTRTELRDALGHRVAATKIDDALELLEEAGIARHVDEPTGGRPAERWFVVQAEGGEHDVA